jgi:acyl-coenzyme A thioesterase 13
MSEDTTAAGAPAAAPAGFGPMFRSSPLLDLIGGFYSRGTGPELEIGLLIDVQHTNSRGHLHGGVAATLADSGVGYMLAFATDPPRRLVTASLTVDYVAPASVGEWVTVHVDGADTTGRLVFATARLRVAQRVIARVRAVFALSG